MLRDHAVIPGNGAVLCWRVNGQNTSYSPVLVPGVHAGQGRGGEMDPRRKGGGIRMVTFEFPTPLSAFPI